jgi:hypothetical protein
MQLAVSSVTQGVPVVQVPSQMLWDLVEYLSEQRLAVQYSYAGNNFEVRFPRMSLAAVQQTLKDWSGVHGRNAA